MVCNECGDKPTNDSKHFTKAVVEINNPEKRILMRKVVIPASMGTEEEYPTSVGKFFNVLLVYESNGHIYLYSSDGIPTLLSTDIGELERKIEELQIELTEETTAREEGDSALSSQINSLSSSLSSETTARQNADTNLQSQIDAITASSDVTDIVGTYAQLQAYDTSKLGDNDIIKVLQDELHNDETTYYRWSTATQQFTLIGEEGPYYTKSQTDTLLNGKQDTLTAGTGIDITNNVISATSTNEVKELTTADYNYPTANPDGIALWLLEPGTYVSYATKLYNSTSSSWSSLGRWQATVEHGTINNVDVVFGTVGATNASFSYGTEATGSSIYVRPVPPIVQNAGTSTTDVMSQNATTSMVFADPGARRRIKIGQAAGANGTQSVAIGYGANASASSSVAIGKDSYASQIGQFDISTGTTPSGYNNSGYRLLTGLYDPQNDHDAATKGYVDTAVAGAGITVLTTADYNYPASNPNCVALWLLEPGMYMVGEQILFRPSGANLTVLYANTILIASRAGLNSYATVGLWGSDAGSYEWDSIRVRTADGSVLVPVSSLPTGIVDTLTNSSTNVALSANQGKVLNDKIGGDLSNLTTTDKTSLINAINEIAGQSGGGGITELTSADYNWPTADPAGVALWLLEPGLYSWGENVRVLSQSDMGIVAPGVAWVWESNNGFTQILTLSNNDRNYLMKVNSTTGATASSVYPIKLGTTVVQTTGTSTTNVMSQKAVTDALATAGANEINSTDWSALWQ